MDIIKTEPLLDLVIKEEAPEEIKREGEEPSTEELPIKYNCAHCP